MMIVQLYLIYSLCGFLSPLIPAVVYEGEHRKLEGPVELKLGLGDLNRAYGYFKIGNAMDSVERGGTIITENLERDTTQWEIHLQSGAWLKVADWGSDKIKVRYYDIARWGTKPLRLRLEKKD